MTLDLFEWKPLPPAPRPRLKLNSARCLICKDVLVSRSRHDFVECSGGHIFIDGGLDYVRRGTLTEGLSFNDIEDLCEYEIPENRQGGE